MKTVKHNDKLCYALMCTPGIEPAFPRHSSYNKSISIECLLKLVWLLNSLLNNQLNKSSNLFSIVLLISETSTRSIENVKENKWKRLI